MSLQAIVGHETTIEDLDFSPDGQFMVSIDSNGVLRRSFTDYHMLIDFACQHISRDFTERERLDYPVSTEETCPS